MAGCLRPVPIGADREVVNREFGGQVLLELKVQPWVSKHEQELLIEED